VVDKAGVNQIAEYPTWHETYLLGSMRTEVA
jgi:hypothetical protein